MARQSGCGTERNLRETEQRNLVLRILEMTEGHPTAQAVFEKARHEMPAISLGTVYRNLRLLVKQGTLIESKFGKMPARFEVRKQRHYHICCVDCGRLEDLAFPYQSGLDRRIERLARYQLQEHRMEFYGVCPQCQAKRAAKAMRPRRRLQALASPVRK